MSNLNLENIDDSFSLEKKPKIKVKNVDSTFKPICTIYQKHFYKILNDY